MTAYRKLPFAYPLLMARKACRKAMPSRPWLKANAQRDGFWIRDQDISLGVLVHVRFREIGEERKKYHVLLTS